ncbi:putative secreted protein with PEP-CTERM sorting signal [Sphaerotilus hippei]|uniref:Putative secreted protein with PEP-CTERM sorting signal n=1 Tax=Sphaerotilus hippei TaxID=744406 RepID=A0A318H8F6_9BURK|nr:PEP-CTERM sorting domain-containing protein [Sphaerotilus hippei]PXW99188.1 putative secreted protein with PEP-CTERM sorting signal [Sphaerotilus hippei]
MHAHSRLLTLAAAMAMTAANVHAGVFTYTELETLPGGNSNSIGTPELVGPLAAGDTLTITGYIGASSPDFYSFITSEALLLNLTLKEYTNANFIDTFDNGAANGVLGLFNGFNLLTYSSENSDLVDTISSTYTLSLPGTFKTAVAGYSPGISPFDSGGLDTGWYYRLEISATAAPVPESSTLMMMLAGLGATGLVAHRRRQRPAA